MLITPTTLMTIPPVTDSMSIGVEVNRLRPWGTSQVGYFACPAGPTRTGRCNMSSADASVYDRSILHRSVQPAPAGAGQCLPCTGRCKLDRSVQNGPVGAGWTGRCMSLPPKSKYVTRVSRTYASIDTLELVHFKKEL